MTDISIPEKSVCRLLCPLLNEHAVGDSLGQLTTQPDLLSAIDYFLPEVLREVHNEWQRESLDGVYPKIFHKTGDREIEIVGLALFISDQTLTPLHVRLQLSATFDCVSWIDLRLGEHSAHGCRRVPSDSPGAFGTMLHVTERLNSIDWYYHVCYGEHAS